LIDVAPVTKLVTRFTWLRVDWAKMSFEKLLKETEDRWRWRRFVHEVTNLRNEDG